MINFAKFFIALQPKMDIPNKYYLQLNLRGKLHTWSNPLIMGILNITDDSFYKESCVLSTEQIIEKAGTMLDEGADILDLGAQSTRPGASVISSNVEIERLIPAIQGILKNYPQAILSIDTYYSEVARYCILSGAHIINDISAGDMDTNMLKTVSENNIPFIAMHMQGTPQSMQIQPYYEDVCCEVSNYLQAKLKQASELGIKDVIVDCGFGFGKTIEHNYSLLRNLKAIKNVIQAPILVGISRKSMLWKLFNSSPQEMLPATSALNLFALQQGADILRVHDIKEAVQIRFLHAEYLNPLTLPKKF